MATPFVFLLVIIPIAFLAAYFFYRGLQGHPGGFIFGGVGFLIVSIYLFAIGIPSEPTITTTVVSATVTTNVISYATLKASNDAVVRGLAYLFASFTLLSLALGIGAVPQSLINRIKLIKDKNQKEDDHY